MKTQIFQTAIQIFDHFQPDGEILPISDFQTLLDALYSMKKTRENTGGKETAFVQDYGYMLFRLLALDIYKKLKKADKRQTNVNLTSLP